MPFRKSRLHAFSPQLIFRADTGSARRVGRPRALDVSGLQMCLLCKWKQQIEILHINMEFKGSFSQFPFILGMCKLRLGGESSLRNAHTQPELWWPVPLRVSSVRTLATVVPGLPSPGPAAIDWVLGALSPILISKRWAGQLLLLANPSPVLLTPPSYSYFPKTQPMALPFLFQETEVVRRGCHSKCVVPLFWLHWFNCFLTRLCSPGSERCCLWWGWTIDLHSASVENTHSAVRLLRC